MLRTSPAHIAELAKLRDHSHAVSAIAVSGNTLYSGARSVKVWDLSSPMPEMIACLRKHMSNIKQIIVDESNGLIFSAGCSVKVSMVLRSYSSTNARYMSRCGIKPYGPYNRQLELIRRKCMQLR